MHVLLADSGKTILHIISRSLQYRGDTVRCFTDGREALSYLQTGPKVDVLLTGFELRSLSGLELCWETIMLPNEEPPIYVIVMSSSSEHTKLVEALDSGADDFLRKPFASQELCARMRAAERVRHSQLDLIRLAKTDPLTGVGNRRSFFESAEKAIESTPAGSPSAAIMLDIDQFKSVNDKYGHHVGDVVLRELSAKIGSICEIFGRLGGEEFAAFLPGSSMHAAYQVAEVMRKAVAELRISAGDTTLIVTCSFGVSEWREGDDFDALLRRADNALYWAKIRGRNQTVMADIENNEHGDKPAELDGISHENRVRA